MSFAKFRDAAKDNPRIAGGDSALDSPTEGFSASSPAGEAVIAAGSKIVGKLSFEGPVQLDGQVEGEIFAKSNLVIGVSAVVNAKVVGGEICIRGTVSGDVSASKRLALQKPARITGNISAPVLSVEEGVFFEGSCKMEGDLASSR